MVINFNISRPKVYFTGDLPVYSSYKLSLVSKYSNLPLKNNSSYFPLKYVTQGTDWFVFEIAQTIQFEGEEINTYFDCILYGYDELDREYFIQKTLCKAFTEHADEDSADVEYVSDNENNEQFIYYNND